MPRHRCASPVRGLDVRISQIGQTISARARRSHHSFNLSDPTGLISGLMLRIIINGVFSEYHTLCWRRDGAGGGRRVSGVGEGRSPDQSGAKSGCSRARCVISFLLMMCAGGCCVRGCLCLGLETMCRHVEDHASIFKSRAFRLKLMLKMQK